MDIRLDKQGYQYEEMVNLTHPTSRKHPRMAVQDRAAQFAPFAALSGFETAIRETARRREDAVEQEQKGDCVLE